jgi:hypothetical protein
VLDLGDFPDALFIFDDIAGANIDAADLHGAVGLLLKEMVGGHSAATRMPANIARP